MLLSIWRCLMTLEERIVRLERQNRWMKRAGGLAVVLVGLFVTLGQSNPQDTVIMARGFIIVDEKGEKRGEFGFSGPRTGPRLDLFGAAGEAVRLTSEKLVLSKTQGASGLPFLSLTLSSEPSIMLLGAEEATILIDTERLGPTVHLGCKSGQAALWINPEHGSQMLLGTPGDLRRVQLTAHKDITSLHLKRKEGTVFLGINADIDNTDGQALLRLRLKKGTVLLGVDAESGPKLAILDSDEKGLFKAP